MPWLLNFAYLLLLVALLPVLLYRMIVRGKYRDGWGEKLFGRLPARDPAAPALWLHAVSVGEVLQLQPIVRELERRLAGYEFVITTTTATGLAVAREKFGGPRHRVCYFPLDFSWAVRRALERVRPAAVVLVELELWPNFIAAAAKRNVPLALINGRISERSFRGYRRIAPLMRKLLGRFDVLAVQNATYRQRLLELGASAERVMVTGSVKFDGVETGRENPQTAALRRAFGLRRNERVFIAGSTHAPEEEFAIHSWLELRDEFPDLRLILAPRHKERFEEVAALVQSHGIPLVRRTETDSRGRDFPAHPARGAAKSTHPPPVLLLDTLGELGGCWGLADVAFVGGSLTKRGGQNMIEPAAYGAAVLFGPNTENFRDVVELLLAEEAARVVADRDELTEAVRSLLADATSTSRLGERARQVVLSQQGATKHTVELITALPIPPPRGTSAERPKAA